MIRGFLGEWLEAEREWLVAEHRGCGLEVCRLWTEFVWVCGGIPLLALSRSSIGSRVGQLSRQCVI